MTAMTPDLEQRLAELLSRNDQQVAPVARLPRGPQWVGGVAIVAVLALSGGMNLQVSDVDKALADLSDKVVAMQEEAKAAGDHRARIAADLAATDTRFGVLEATVKGLESARSKNQERFEIGAENAESLQADSAIVIRRLNAMLDQCEFRRR